MRHLFPLIIIFTIFLLSTKCKEKGSSTNLDKKNNTTSTVISKEEKEVASKEQAVTVEEKDVTNDHSINGSEGSTNETSEETSTLRPVAAEETKPNEVILEEIVSSDVVETEINSSNSIDAIKEEVANLPQQVADSNIYKPITKKGWRIIDSENSGDEGLFEGEFHPNGGLTARNFNRPDNLEFQLVGTWRVSNNKKYLTISFKEMTPIQAGQLVTNNKRKLNMSTKYSILELTDNTMIIISDKYGKYWMEATQ